MPSLQTIDDTVFTVSTGANIAANATPSTYTSTGLTSTDGQASASTFTTNLFTASDPGSLLDLSSVQSIDAGYLQNSNDYNRHEITASTGASILLTGTHSVAGPSSSNDWIRFQSTSPAVAKIVSGRVALPFATLVSCESTLKTRMTRKSTTTRRICCRQCRKVTWWICRKFASNSTLRSHHREQGSFCGHGRRPLGRPARLNEVQRSGRSDRSPPGVGRANGCEGGDLLRRQIL